MLGPVPGPVNHGRRTRSACFVQPRSHRERRDHTTLPKQKRAPKHPSVKLARPERFELPTTKFVAWYSIQLSYGRADAACCVVLLASHRAGRPGCSERASMGKVAGGVNRARRDRSRIARSPASHRSSRIPLRPRVRSQRRRRAVDGECVTRDSLPCWRVAAILRARSGSA